jgi:hypothetical protein
MLERHGPEASVGAGSDVKRGDGGYEQLPPFCISETSPASSTQADHASERQQWVAAPLPAQSAEVAHNRSTTLPEQLPLGGCEWTHWDAQATTPVSLQLGRVLGVVS